MTLAVVQSSDVICFRRLAIPAEAVEASMPILGSFAEFLRYRLSTIAGSGRSSSSTMSVRFGAGTDGE
jgi:hypothetical protein